MQAFILGAGLGTRLAPLSYIVPKPLLPVFQKPLIYHTMEHLMRAGVTEFLVNTSQLEVMWERAFPFPDPQYHGCPVHLSHEERPLDSGGGVRKILPLVQPDEPLIVQNGDILCDFPVSELLAEHRRTGHLVTLALRRARVTRCPVRRCSASSSDTGKSQRISPFCTISGSSGCTKGKILRTPPPESKGRSSWLRWTGQPWYCGSGKGKARSHMTSSWLVLTKNSVTPARIKCSMVW